MLDYKLCARSYVHECKAFLMNVRLYIHECKPYADIVNVYGGTN